LKKILGSHEVEEAAGGLLWREEPKGRMFAIIHRERYGGDWTLPKGKREKGESWLETAIREVKEETGCTAVDVKDFAGTIWYTTDEKIKIVLFWNMSPIGECINRLDPEVTELRWLTKQEAIKLLSYPKEKNFLATVE
jgi:8-oxo-dGTP pyrophosphatase MutT (NUDIX family)